MKDTRERLVEASAALLQRQGLTGTGIKQILAEAGAPYSSLYHHFPGGKDELAAAAIRVSGSTVPGAGRGGVGPGADDLISGVAAVFDGAAQTLESTDFAVACPIATVALEVAGTNEGLRHGHRRGLRGVDRGGDGPLRVRRRISADGPTLWPSRSSHSSRGRSS